MKGSVGIGTRAKRAGMTRPSDEIRCNMHMSVDEYWVALPMTPGQKSYLGADRFRAEVAPEPWKILTSSTLSLCD